MRYHAEKPDLELIEDLRARLDPRPRVELTPGLDFRWSIIFDEIITDHGGEFAPCPHAREVAERICDRFDYEGCREPWCTARTWVVPRVLVGHSGLGGMDYDSQACLDCLREQAGEFLSPPAASPED